MASASERELVHAAQGNPETFGILYDQHVDRIFRYLLARTGNVPLAEDLTAETFLAALRGLWRYRWTGKPFSAWLYRIARSRLGEHQRQQHKFPTVALELAEELPDLRTADHMAVASGDKFLAAALEELREGERDVVVLRYFEDLPLGEIAWILKLPVNTVKSHLHRSLLRMRQYLKEQTNEPAITGKLRGSLAPRGAERSTAA